MQVQNRIKYHIGQCKEQAGKARHYLDDVKRTYEPRVSQQVARARVHFGAFRTEARRAPAHLKALSPQFWHGFFSGIMVMFIAVMLLFMNKSP